METQEIQKEVQSLTIQARDFLIQSQEDYSLAGNLWQLAKDLRAKIAETFDPIISKAHATHKEAVAQKKKHDDPLEQGQRTIKGKMIAWDQEQAAIARKKQLELEAAEKKRAEEEALEVASLMEEAGLTEEAAAVIAAPLETAPIAVKKETPKVAGFSYRSNWKAECVDLKAMLEGWKEGKVPIQAFQADESFLRKQAGALKEAFKGMYPGVKCWDEKV